MIQTVRRINNEILAEYDEELTAKEVDYICPSRTADDVDPDSSGWWILWR